MNSYEKKLDETAESGDGKGDGERCGYGGGTSSHWNAGTTNFGCGVNSGSGTICGRSHHANWLEWLYQNSISRITGRGYGTGTGMGNKDGTGHG